MFRHARFYLIARVRNVCVLYVYVLFERFEDEFGHFEITRIFHIRVSRRKVLEELEGHIPSLEESAEVARLPAVLPHPIGVTRAVVVVSVPIAPLVLVGASGTWMKKERHYWYI